MSNVLIDSQDVQIAHAISVEYVAPEHWSSADAEPIEDESPPLPNEFQPYIDSTPTGYVLPAERSRESEEILVAISLSDGRMVLLQQRSQAAGASALTAQVHARLGSLGEPLPMCQAWVLDGDRLYGSLEAAPFQAQRRSTGEIDVTLPALTLDLCNVDVDESGQAMSQPDGVAATMTLELSGLATQTPARALHPEVVEGLIDRCLPDTSELPGDIGTEQASIFECLKYAGKILDYAGRIRNVYQMVVELQKAMPLTWPLVQLGWIIIGILTAVLLYYLYKFLRGNCTTYLG